MISSLELARLCGVSQGTVDRALHDRPGISSATKKRVLEAARKHGYRPHPAARELLTGERRTIGAITPSLTHVFYMDLLGAIRQELVAEGLRMFISPCADEEEFMELLGDFASRRCRATIVVPHHEIDLPEIGYAGMKVVSLISPCHGRDAVFLTPDEQQTGHTAVEYLAKLGHRRLMHLTYPKGSKAIYEREVGFNDAVKQLSLTGLVTYAHDDKHIIQSIQEYKPTAVFCHNDAIAMRLIRDVEAIGMSVPGDLSVLGVDNSAAVVHLFPLSTMNYPMKSMARAAHAVINDEQPEPIEPITVVERKTTRAI